MEPTVVSNPRPRAGRIGRAAVLMAGAAALCTGIPTAAQATTAGAETFTGVLVETGGNVQFPLVARGAFTAVGHDEPLDSEPGDTPNLYRDRMVFPQGTLSFVHRRDVNAIDVDPRTCVATIRMHGAWEIDGGTGDLAGATGSGTVTGSSHGLAQRVDGECSTDVEPLVLVMHVSATGTLSLPELSA